ncbi:hypothetical protein [Streptomyces lancefieldiae]|uniref:Uncharacterized protein n=1 Tax=Streptomyces lancefieldiae TaxID=3075520 RepID=A0ABU3AJ31_9ACTN|nr:hypothetical protein [Streptomyces sp. DSM 40712]MDT0608896.1 hypothetical protein [Streptomyces sp. DSM 40712]
MRAYVSLPPTPHGGEALLTAGRAFGRLATLASNEGVEMAELNYEQLQTRALDNAQQSWNAAGADQHAAEARLLAVAQIQALLAVGAALRDVADAIREGK